MAVKKTREDLMLRYGQMSEWEKQAAQDGFGSVAGIDEAGRGPLAGPVVAAAVILDPRRPVLGVDDSKKLSPDERARLKQEIEEKAVAVGIGIADVETIEAVNILEATKLAMQKAVEDLSVRPDLLLIDAVRLDAVDLPQRPIIKGDALSVSIAAASIIAKETRDAIMISYDALYPEYGFAKHKGYATRFHREAILQYGPLPIHRQSFLRNLYGK